jgi:hypothetical protein
LFPVRARLEIRSVEELRQSGGPNDVPHTFEQMLAISILLFERVVLRVADEDLDPITFTVLGTQSLSDGLGKLPAQHGGVAGAFLC